MLESKMEWKMMLHQRPSFRRLFLILLASCCCCLASVSVESGNSCLRHCVCKWKGGKESVTCHQAGLTEVPASGLEGTVQVLDLSGNPLQQLTANQFRKLGLTHLQRVILQRCSLRHVDTTAFAGLTNLVELDLSHNAMSSIPAQSLQHIPELRELKLNGNPLIRLSGQPFSAASKLVRLELANCQLNSVDHRTFHGLDMLEWLRLDGNLIEALPTATLAPLRTLRGIDLHHNPWNCTCPLRPLRSWLAARNMPFSVPPLCLFPIRLRGQSWNRLPLEELACPPKIRAVQSLVQVQVGQQANLSCHVTSNPEAAVSWFFGERLVVNLTSPLPELDSSNPAVTASSTPNHQIYYIRESSEKVHDRTDKTSLLVLGSAREQDSGFYVCQAANRAERVSVNITLLVKSNGVDQSANLVSRGLTAGLILSLFAVLVLVLLVCCICSLKRARLHANLRHRRPSFVMGVSSMNGSLNASLFDKLDQIDSSSRRHSTAGSETYRNNHHNGSLFKQGDSMDSCGSAAAVSQQNGHDIKASETRFPDKQWLVNLANHSAKSSPDMKINAGDEDGPEALTTDGHRQIAMYQKVKFNADSESAQQQQQQQPRPILKMDKVCSPIPPRNYPDLVDLLPPSDYAASDVTSLQDEMELVQLKRDRSSPAVFPPNRYFKQHHHQPSSRRSSFSSMSGQYRQRRRLSDWEVNELDMLDSPPPSCHPSPHPPMDGYDSEVDSGQVVELIRRHSQDEFVDEDFHRRYAYHTGQLNRFLTEYRALQKRLAQMQDTWGRCLDDDPVRPSSSSSSARHHHYQANHHHHHHGPRPLRPILKNRSSAPRPIRWSSDEQEPEGAFDSDLHGRYDSSSVVDELYYS